MMFTNDVYWFIRAQNECRLYARVFQRSEPNQVHAGNLWGDHLCSRLELQKI